MLKTVSVTPSGIRSRLLTPSCLFTTLILIADMGVAVTAAELRPYSLPSQNMENPGQYQQSRVTEQKVDESFYENFERDSKKYDAKKKAKTNAYLKNKLKKSRTDAEVTHYKRLQSILNGR